MNIIIDRFEDNYAVCEKENRKMINIEICRIPIEVKVGDVLSINNDIITIEKDETKVSKVRIRKLMNSLR